jgi:hypothetical protein
MRPKHIGCQVEGCDQTHYARGYCSRHYQAYRLHRREDGEWDSMKRGFRDTCTVPGCKGKHDRNGLCVKHSSAEIRSRNREFLVGRYFNDGVVCGKCEKSFDLVQMDFHHPNPSRKEHVLAYFVNNSALAERPVLIAEMDACEKLCARCHQNTHHDPKTSHASTYDELNRKKGIQIDRRKAMVREAFGEKCSKCGDWLWPKEMEFHHRDKSGKFGNLSDMFRTASKDAILREVSKCDILCRNCHRLVTVVNGDTVAA